MTVLNTISENKMPFKTYINLFVRKGGHLYTLKNPRHALQESIFSELFYNEPVEVIYDYFFISKSF